MHPSFLPTPLPLQFYVVNLSSATALAAEVATPAGLTPDVAQQALGAAFTAAAESMPDAGCDLAKSGATALVCMVLADRWAKKNTQY